MGVIGYLLFGLVVGAIARLLMPGRDPMGIIGTMVLGIVGSLVGGLIARAVTDNNDGVGWVGAVAGALIALFVYRQVAGRETTV